MFKIKKFFTLVLMLFLMVGVGSAAWRMNPYTGRLDYYEPIGAGTLGGLGDVTLSSIAGGAILYRNAANDAWVNLAKGTNTHVLTLVGGLPAWAATTGVTTFLGLTDTPAAYTGKAGQLVIVNAGANAVEFFAGSAVGTVIVADGSGGWTKDANFNIVSGKVSAGGYEGTAIANTYIAGIDQDLLVASSPTFTDLTVSTPSNIYGLSHNSFANWAANQHVVLPGLIANVLSDHTLLVHTTLGLFDASSDVDHDQTTNYDVNKHTDHTAVSVLSGGLITGGGTIDGNQTLTLSEGTIEAAIDSLDNLADIRIGAIADVTFFGAATSAETRQIKIVGFRSGDQARTFEIGVGEQAADTVSFEGLSNYLFDGRIQAPNITLDNELVVNDDGTTGEVGVDFYSINSTYSTIAQSDAEGIGNSSDLRIGLDESLRALYLMDRGDIATDFGSTAYSDPTLVFVDAQGNDYAYIAMEDDEWTLKNVTGVKICYEAALSHEFYVVGAGADLTGTGVFVFAAQSSSEFVNNAGQQNFFEIQPWVNQSGTAAYSAFLIDVTETNTGSGTNELLTLRVGGVDKFTVSNAGAVTLASGTSVNEFSIDGTMGGNSDYAVPTEKAVKTYVDTNYQPLDAALTDLSTVATTAGRYIRVTGIDGFEERTTANVLADISAQASDAALTDISGLVYVSPSFIKLVANDDYSVRTLAETASDLEASIESVIDTLANLTSIQGQNVTFSGSLNVEANSNINQDVTSDGSPTFGGLTVVDNPLRENLLTNSGFGVSSQSTFENVSNQITVTDITNGVCTTGDTEDLQVGDLVLFAGDAAVNGNVYEATAVVVDTTFTIHDLTVNPGAVVATTCFEKTPAFIAADIYASDTWTKTDTLDLHRWFNHATYHKGMYGLKVVKGADGVEYLNAFGSIFDKDYHYLQYRGRTITLACWIYSDTVADNVKLQINDSDGTTESSFVVADTLTWVEITRTCGVTITSFTPRILFDGDTADVAYVSQPTFVLGSSIGEGNYQPKQQEVIWLEAYIASKLEGDNLSDVALADLNIEVDTDGKLSKGCKAIQVYTTVRDSNSLAQACHFLLTTDSASMINRPSGKADDAWSSIVGWLGCNSDGDIEYEIAASDANTMDIGGYRYLAIQVN